MSQSGGSDIAKRCLEDVLSFFGENPKVTSRIDGETIELNVDTDATGKLIGYRGETLRAIQHLVNAMVRERSEEKVYVQIDIAGYRKSRAEQLTAKAHKAAQRAIEDGAEVPMPPMPAGDRRIVHAALGEIKGVRTESRGEEPRRHLVVIPEA